MTKKDVHVITLSVWCFHAQDVYYQDYIRSNEDVKTIKEDENVEVFVFKNIKGSELPINEAEIMYNNLDNDMCHVDNFQADKDIVVGLSTQEDIVIDVNNDSYIDEDGFRRQAQGLNFNYVEEAGNGFYCILSYNNLLLVFYKDI